MRRVSVVGNSASGKSTLARRVAALLDVPYFELDAIFHQPNWTPADPAVMQAEIERITALDGWVVDGNYSRYVVDGPVWKRADTVVWLDPPRHLVMRQVVRRTVRRVVRRESLWNGNRERFAHVVSWNPERSIIRWAWTQHAKYRERYETAMADPSLAHLAFVRLGDHSASRDWLARIEGSPSANQGGLTKMPQRPGTHH